MIARGGLRLRKGPGTNYDIILTIPNGTYLDCYGFLSGDDTWIYVGYYQEKSDIYFSGWVHSDYVKFECENWDD